MQRSCNHHILFGFLQFPQGSPRLTALQKHCAEGIVSSDEAYSRLPTPETQPLNFIPPFHVWHANLQHGPCSACARNRRYVRTTHLSTIERGRKRQRPVQLQLADHPRKTVEPRQALARLSTACGQAL